MKKYNSIFLMVGLILTMLFSGCSDDEKEVIPPVPEELPELQFDTESAFVKIGSENKYILELKQGGGQYNVFSLDDNIAKAEIVDNKIFIEGFVNGKTSIVASDKNGFYRKLPVTVYTFDKIELTDNKFEVTTKLGSQATFKSNIINGNGTYKIKSDNAKIEASIADDGTITISGTSQPEVLSGKITLTDASDLSASIEVTINSTTVPFTKEELDAIKNDNARRYNMNGGAVDESSYNHSAYVYYNTIDNGQQLYGYNYYNYIYCRLWYTGDKAVGTKKDAKLTYSNYNYPPNYANQPVNFEIIKNDGENIWGIISFIQDNILRYGYFCDKI